MFPILARGFLLVALAAFGLQVGSAGALRCEMMAAAETNAHRHAGNDKPADHGQHTNQCICVAGCQSTAPAFGIATVHRGPLPNGPIAPVTGPVPAWAAVDRDHLLPPSQAPPFLV
jgi:hypothetical protein